MPPGPEYGTTGQGEPYRASGGVGKGLRGPIGVLAIQGSFALHVDSLRRLGLPSRLVRKPTDLAGLSGLILPGGESTVMSLLMEKYGLFEPIRELGRSGFPMFGTCAGAILLGCGEGIPRRLEVAPLELVRNAYGTQVDSFTAPLHLRPFPEPFLGIFIRAPRIVRLGISPPQVPEAARAVSLGDHGGDPVLVEAGRFLLATFHPELTDDLRVHELFVRRFVRGEVPDPILASPAEAGITARGARR
jgi:5'-phosphate synthase pdxT subunit